MTLETLIPLKARTGIAAITFVAMAAAITCGGRCIHLQHRQS